MTTPPPGEIKAPTAEETAAIENSKILAEIKAVAEEIRKSSQLGFTPGSIIKGIVTAINHSGTPPTVTVNIGGDTSTPIADVRIIDNYTPEIGQTVLIEKQGAQIVVAGHTASGSAMSDGDGGGWIKATLTNGSHNGNSNGDVEYRRVLDHGSWKMQWRGGWSPGGSTTMISGGQSLPDGYQPAVPRTVLTARSQESGATSLHIVFGTSGTVTITNPSNAGNSASVSGDVDFVSMGGSTTYVPLPHLHTDGSGFATSVTDDGHSHGISTNSHNHFFSGGSHSHSYNSPSWVSLNKVEYFL